jgi:D-alanyl-D-alanine carboxypeptidase
VAMLHLRLRKVWRLAKPAFLAAVLLLPVNALANPKMLVDLGSGQVLYHQDAFQRWYPASLAKLMTAYVTFEALKAGRITLDTPVVMSLKAVNQKPSKMYLKPGDRMTLDTALKIMLVKSANDIAWAVAETVGGSEPRFVGMMNHEARRIGLTSTHYVNPNGMPQNGQYTTARDLAVLAVRIRREFPQYDRYFALEGFITGDHKYSNYNLLIGRFDGADGMKTGFICSSGFNQVASATRGGRTVISVVLGSNSLAGRADESAELLHLGLTKHIGVGTTLTSLRPYGAHRNQVADIRDQICSKKARKARSKNRDKAGRMKLISPYIHPLNHQLHYVEANLLPPIIPPVAANDNVADGDGGPDIANVPIPQPRPLRWPIPQLRPVH